MAHLVTCLPCKHEDLNLDLTHTYELRAVVYTTANLTVGMQIPGAL